MDCMWFAAENKEAHMLRQIFHANPLSCMKTMSLEDIVVIP